MLAACNSAEVLICGLGLRRMLPGGFDPGQLKHLALGAVLALAGALTAAALAAAYLGLFHGRDFPLEFAIWTMADLLGIMILTPCLLILADARAYLAERPPSWPDAAILLAALAAETYVFAQTQFPLLYLVAVATLTVSMTVEMLGAAIMVLATAALAIGFTFAGQGPIVLSSSGWTEQLLQMQAFVAVCSVLSLQSAARQQQRRAYARALTVAVAEAERSARVKAEFLANMSHEIRTPLTSILGFASLLSEKKLDEEAGRYAGRVLSASRNLLALVNDVLDFSKLEAGQLEIKPKPGDPAECGRDVVELFLAQAQAKALSLRFSGRGLPGHVMADFDRVRQVLMNLVGNAVKFTDAGSVRV